MQNAQIKSTMLGTEDHGIFTFIIDLDYGGAGQGFGMFCLDEPVFADPAKTKFVRRQGTAFGMDAIMRLLEVVGVESWEKLPGKFVRVEGGGFGTNGADMTIYNVLDDKLSLNLKALVAEWEQQVGGPQPGKVYP